MRNPSYSPSNMARIINCPGSVELCRHDFIEEEENVHAIAGTRAHAFGEHVLELGTNPFDYIGTYVPYEDKYNKKIDRVLVDEKLAESIALYADFVRSKMQGNLSGLYIEYKFTPSVNFFGVKTTAYTDAMVITPGAQEMHIFDYKNGAGAVPVLNNVQMADYGLLALAAYKVYRQTHAKTHDISDIKNLYLHIVQPNSFNSADIKTWHIDDVPAFQTTWLKKIRRAIRKAKTLTNMYKVSSECFWCKGMMACPKLKELVNRIRTMEGAQMELLTNEEISEFLKRAPVVKKYLDTVEVLAKQRCRDGVKIPGKKLVPTTKNYRSWKNERFITKFLLKRCNFELSDVIDSKLKSPAQVDALLKKTKVSKKHKADVKQYIQVTPRTYENLVDDDDTREDLGAFEDHFEEEFI